MRINTEEALRATRRTAEAPVAGVQDKARRWEALKAIPRRCPTPRTRGQLTEEGVGLYLAVVFLIPLGLIVALFMDAGRLYVTRGRMQVAADAAALAGASGFIDGNEEGDSVQARAAQFVAANPIGTSPATLESLSMNTDSGMLSLVLSHRTGSLLLAPDGITIRIRANARATLVQPGQVGLPIPKENAFNWWKHEETSPGASDSGIVRLGS